MVTVKSVTIIDVDPTEVFDLQVDGEPEFIAEGICVHNSFICAARSGGAWDLETGKPLPQSTVDIPYPGPAPWHWRCRTVMIAVLKSFEELFGAKGRAFDEELKALGPGTQSSMDGQVAGGQTFEGWLSKQTEARQIEALGRGRAQLWRDGKISLSDLIDQRGRPLTIDELKRVA